MGRQVTGSAIGLILVFGMAAIADEEDRGRTEEKHALMRKTLCVRDNKEVFDRFINLTVNHRVEYLCHSPSVQA